jgi:hypothetical protein
MAQNQLAISDGKPTRNTFQQLQAKDISGQKIDHSDRQDAVAGQAQGIKDHCSNEWNPG